MHRSILALAMTPEDHELPSGRVNGLSAKPPITAVIADVGFVGDVPLGDID